MVRNAKQVLDLIIGATFKNREWFEQAVKLGANPVFAGYSLAHLAEDNHREEYYLIMSLVYFPPALRSITRLKASLRDAMGYNEALSEYQDEGSKIRLKFSRSRQTSVDHFAKLLDHGPAGLNTWVLYYNKGEGSLESLLLPDHKLPWLRSYRLPLPQTISWQAEEPAWLDITLPKWEKEDDCYAKWSNYAKRPMHSYVWKAIFADLSYIDAIVSRGRNAIVVSRYLPFLFSQVPTKAIDVIVVILGQQGDCGFEDDLLQKPGGLRESLHPHSWNEELCEATYTDTTMTVNIWQCQKQANRTAVYQMLDTLCQRNEESQKWETYMMYACDADFGLYKKECQFSERENMFSLELNQCFHLGEAQHWKFYEYDRQD
ncbi:uncharacterized protein CTRU02_212481 [Colletotrichum truncatum]|uniref:Uncharacterized protein n=1 Tax=Colletotrichum truncatum TaxID=5467 RepID=A0ACC3YNN7_COLTU|nr:uncharacterized protein CTRU02_05710 [Colletotrichum truncatum]KAF6794153.1 hypothetical protein CTRU02_05710 [Colletotrichum truncatum]